MRTIQIDAEKFRKELRNVIQTRVHLADTQNIWIDAGRGTGKSSYMLAPRLVRVAYDMPRAHLLLIAPTYVDLLSNILPAITSYLNNYMVRGLHYEYGTSPPKHFKLPIRDVGDYKKALIFENGTAVRFGSMDRPEGILGADFVHIFADELLRYKEEDFVERIIPTLRSNRALWGRSPYYGGITGGSSTPNLDSDHDWWLKQEQNQDSVLIDQIMDVALSVDHAKFRYHNSKSEAERRKAESYILRWGEKLRIKRKGATTFIKASSLSNILILGIEYLQTQMSGSVSAIEKFKLSILGIRPKKVAEMFFGKFTQKHIYKDSYNYYRIDLLDATGNYIRSSRDLKYCNPDAPLLAGYDPGHFSSIVFAQEKVATGSKQLKVFKNIYVTHPQSHSELADAITHFFRDHNRKYIYLYHDRAANQQKSTYQSNAAGKTDARILQAELVARGWRVELMDLKRETIYHYLHYILLNILLGEKDKRTPRISICQNECPELVSSIWHSPLLRKGGEIYLDKSSEDKLDLEDQAMYSTQLGTALMYLIFGLYEKFLPLKAKAARAHGGL